MRHLRYLSAIALTLACASPMVAQETVGTLVGTLSDLKTGKPLAGAKVLLRSPKMLGERTTVTAEDGSYRIPLLPNGDYTLTSTKDGYATGTTHCTVLAGQVIRQNIRLTTNEAQSATVVVVADAAAQIDKTDTTTATVLTPDTLSALTNPGDLLGIVNLAPGVALGGTETGTTVSIRGGNAVGGRFLINGMNASDPGWGSFNADQMMVADMIESVSVVESPLNARYGNTESGMISYVTTHGSNEFKGTIKAYYGRGTLNGTPVDDGARQVYRYGSDPSTHQVSPQGDGIGRTFEATFSGPIWKDHITFAWGGRFTPSTFSDNIISRDWQNTAGGGNVISKDYSTYLGGTLYEIPGSGGAQIRRGNLYDQGKHYGSSYNSSFNQYALFFQINAEHSLEWSFSQSNSVGTGLLGGYSLANYGQTGSKNSVYNMAYKGIFGSSVLEARFSHSSFDTIVPPNDGNPYVTTASYGTWLNTNFDPSTATNVAAASLRLWDPTLNNGAGGYGPAANYPYQNLVQARRYEPNIGGGSVMGSSLDKSDSRGNTSLYVNLQSFWGAHQVDLGLNYENSSWDTAAFGPPYSINAPGGQIANDLTSADVFYPAGYTDPRITDVSAYAGQWVTWAAHANLIDLWPAAVTSGAWTAAQLANQPYAYQHTGATSMTRYSGLESGTFSQPTTSLYANDLWTLSPRVSVMAGLRYDHFALKDDRGTVFSYNSLSPRFEFKWDPNGDQKRLISYSFGRFHNRIPSAVFMAFVHRRHATLSNFSWDPTTDGKPFDPSNPGAHPLQNPGYQLVSTAELMNPANYTMFSSIWSPEMVSLDPNFRAEYTDEHTLRFQRAYDSGSKLGFALVRRDWKNNYQWIGDPYRFAVTDPITGKQVETYHSRLAYDPGLFHNYTAAEITWDLKLSKRLTFGGNYTYSREAKNMQYWSAQAGLRPDNVGTMHYAWGMRWEDLDKRFGYSTYDITEPDCITNQTTKFWFLYDLSRGGVKSSVALVGSYQTGGTYTMQYGTNLDPSSALWQSVMSQVPSNYTQADPNLIGRGYSGLFYHAPAGTSVGGFQYPDTYDVRLKYFLDVPVSKAVRWTISVEVGNVLNHVWTANMVMRNSRDLSLNQAYNIAGDTANSYNHNGYLMDGGVMRSSGPDYRGLGGRTYTVETGIKF